MCHNVYCENLRSKRGLHYGICIPKHVARYVDFNNGVATSDEYVYCICCIHLIPLSLKYFTFPIILKRTLHRTSLG